MVYCLFSLIAQIYLCSMSKVGNVRTALEIIFYIVAIFLVGLVEELVFRGVIFNLLLNSFPKTRKGITGAIVLGGVLFGLMHFVNILSGVKFTSALIQVISAALMGILFCTIYASTRNFWMLVISMPLLILPACFPPEFSMPEILCPRSILSPQLIPCHLSCWQFQCLLCCANQDVSA